MAAYAGFAFSPYRWALDQGIPGLAALDVQTVTIDDVERDPRVRLPATRLPGLASSAPWSSW